MIYDLNQIVQITTLSLNCIIEYMHVQNVPAHPIVKHTSTGNRTA